MLNGVLDGGDGSFVRVYIGGNVYWDRMQGLVE